MLVDFYKILKEEDKNFNTPILIIVVIEITTVFNIQETPFQLEN